MATSLPHQPAARPAAALQSLVNGLSLGLTIHFLAAGFTKLTPLFHRPTYAAHVAAFGRYVGVMGLQRLGADPTSVRVGAGAAEVFLAMGLLTVHGNTAAWVLKAAMVAALATRLAAGETVVTPAAVLGVLFVLTTVRGVLRRELLAATKRE
ncbi:hypothetical protein MMPV_009542 [Pyropia vietnamensis]